MSEFQTDNTMDLSLADIMGMIRERIWLGLFLGTFFFCIGIALYFTQQKQYQAEAVMIVDPSTKSVIDIDSAASGSVGSGLGSGFLMEVSLRNQEAILNSRTFINRVIDSFSEDEIFKIKKPYIQEGEELADIFEIIDEQKKVVHTSGTQLFTIAYKHHDPEICVLVANRFAKEYISYINYEMGSSNESALLFLENRVQELKDQLADNELELQTYREENNLVSLNEEGDLASREIKAVSDKLNAVKLEILDLETLHKQINNAESSNDLLDIPYIASFTNIPSLRKKLNQTELELAKLRDSLLENHPSLIQMQTYKQSILVSIQDQIENAMRELLNRKKQLIEQRDDLARDLQNAEARKLAFDKVRIKYNVLERKSHSIERTYDYIITRLHETQISSQLDNTNIRIIDEATLDNKPVWPQKKVFGLISILFFGIGAFIVPIVLEFIDLRVKSVRDVEHHLGLKSLGVVPYSKEAARMEKTSIQYVHETLLECFNGLYKQIDLTSATAPPKALLISSISASEGKSFLISALGLTYSRYGFKTLMLDCDFRKPVLHKIFGLENKDGLINANLDENCLRCEPKKISDNLDLMVSGGTTHKTAEYFDGLSFKNYILKMKESYDMILIDSPPASYFPDFLFLAEVADEFILAIKHKEVKRDGVRFAFSQLQKSRVNVLGCVLTMAPTSVHPGYSHYNYYGEDEPIDYEKKES